MGYAMAEKDEKEQTEAGEGTEEEGAGGGKSKKKMLVIIVITLLFVISAAVAGFFFVSKGGDAEENKEEKEPSKAKAQKSFFYELPDITVNLASGGSRFLRLSVVLEVKNEKAMEKLKKIQPRVIDDFQVYLRELRPEDLSGSAGSYRLRHDLLLRANQAAQPVVVENVLFKEFLVQ